MTGNDASVERVAQTGVPVASFHDDRLDMAHWYPMIRDLDVPTPETQPLPLDRSGEGPPEWDTGLASQIVENLGGEAFARSGFKSAQMHHSGSHIVSSASEEIESTLMELLSQHAMMGMRIGESLWLRDYLDVDFCAYAREPLVPEVRVFIRDGEVVCHHPRLEGFEDHPDHRETAEDFIESGWDGEHRDATVQDYAQRVAEAVDGWWSVDFIMDRSGAWYCTDMALDAVYWREDQGQWSGISEHSGDCEHDIRRDAESLDPPEQREGWR